jgi:hypothetical protein
LHYTANAAGSWGGNAEYNWYSSLTDHSLWGYVSGGDPILLQSPGIQTFEVPYPYALSMTKPDHVFISVHDSYPGDGAEATNNYYMHFHDVYEPVSWPEDTGNPWPLSPYKVLGPDPEVPS